MRVIDPIGKEMYLRRKQAEMQIDAKQKAAAQGSWSCRGCGQRISANKGLCLACNTRLEESRALAANPELTWEPLRNAPIADDGKEPHHRITNMQNGPVVDVLFRDGWPDALQPIEPTGNADPRAFEYSLGVEEVPMRGINGILNVDDDIMPICTSGEYAALSREHAQSDIK